MTIQKDIRHAKKTMAKSPVQGVLACLALLKVAPQHPQVLALLRKMDARQRRKVINDVSALISRGDIGHALALLTPLGRTHPADAALAEAEARCLMALGRWQDMADRLAPPLRKTPDHPGLLTAMGVALFNLGQGDDALSHLLRAAHARPFDPHVQSHLGGALLAAGHVDKARAAFRAAVTEGGGVPEAWPNLANLIDFAEEPALAQRLASLGPDAAKTEAQRECLGFARAKAHLDLGEIEAGFAELHRANARHRARRPYDSAAQRARVMALIDRLPEGLASQGANGPRPILIVGMPRSGTTLMERILAAHPDVAGLGELPDLDRLVADIDGPGAWTADGLRRLGQGYCDALAAGGQPVAVDKMPGNALIAGFALAALPQARVLHMRRDPVAVGLSAYRRRFTEGADFAFDLTELGERARLTDDVMALWHARFPERCRDVVYEDLVDHPDETIAALLAWLDLSQDATCLAFAGASGDVRSASAAQVRAPIARQATADWQPYSAHLQPLIDALGDLPARHQARMAHTQMAAE